jgi:hypothetical protein
LRGSALFASAALERDCCRADEEGSAHECGSEPPKQRAASTELEPGADSAQSVGVHQDRAPAAGPRLPVEREGSGTADRLDPERLVDRGPLWRMAVCVVVVDLEGW